MRAVLDTNTVVSALLWGGTPYALIAAATDQRLDLFSSRTMLDELAAVLARPKFADKLSAAQRTALQLVEQYRGLVDVVDVAAVVPSVSPDRDDDHVLAAALAADVDLIVSGDVDLRALESYRGIDIVSAAECLRRLDEHS